MVALFLEPSWKAWLPAAADDAVRGTIFASLSSIARIEKTLAMGPFPPLTPLRSSVQART
jgi:hypothetical protein